MQPLAAALALLSGTGNELAVTYDLGVDPERARVDVVCTIENPDPIQALAMVEKGYAFAQLPAPRLVGPIEARAGDHRVEVAPVSPYRWTVETAGATRLELRYTVALDHRQQPEVVGHDEYEFPYLAADHGMLVAATLFVFPHEREVARWRVHFELPPGWDVITPWSSVGEHEFEPLSSESISGDLIAVGAWDVDELRVGDFVTTLAFAPGQGELRAQALGPLSRIVAAELELFERPSAGRYLFLFGRPDGPGFGGSPKTSSMTLSVEPRMHGVAGSYLTHLVAHEFFHTWAAAVTRMPDELRWLNEGVTDYFAHLVPARLGLSSAEDCSRAIAEKLQATGANPLWGEVSLVDAGGPAFFEGGDAYRLVYDGGLLIGAWIDLALRSAGAASLDDLMRAFLNDPRWVETDAEPSLADFLALLARFTSDDLAGRVGEAVTGPFAPDFPALFGELGVPVARTTVPPTLRANFDGACVTDIDPAGSAYRLGVRAGDCFLEIASQPVTSAEDIHGAWRAALGSRLQALVRRADETVVIDTPLLEEVHFEVPADPWRTP